MMITSKNIFFSVTVIWIACINIVLAEVIQGGKAEQPIKEVNEQLIQFKGSDILIRPDIKFVQASYQHSPQIPQEYSIVHTAIYPKQQQKSKFVASVPKDSFVNKLTQNNNPKDSIVKPQEGKNTPADDKKPTEQSQVKAQNQEKKNEEKQKQAEQKAEDILKKETLEQQAKKEEEVKKEQTKKQQKTQTDKILQAHPQPKQAEKPIPQKEQIKKPQSLQLKQITESTQGSQDQQPPHQKQQPSHVSPPASQKDLTPKQPQDLFALNHPKSTPQIQKSESTIKFKQHQISKPLQITNYPFEHSQQKQENKQEEKAKVNPVEEKKIVVEEKDVQGHGNLQKDNKVFGGKVEEKGSKQEEKKAQQIEQKPKGIIATDTPKDQLKPKKDENQVVKKPTEQPKSQKPLKSEPQTSQQQQPLDPQLIDQFNKLTKSLMIDPSQLQSQLRFQTLVREQITESDWKLLMIKVLICLTILVAIYQATCSSESQEKKIEKGKYSPVGFSQLDSESSLEMAQRIDQHR